MPEEKAREALSAFLGVNGTGRTQGVLPRNGQIRRGMLPGRGVEAATGVHVAARSEEGARTSLAGHRFAAAGESE